jgi:hypothetical protein
MNRLALLLPLYLSFSGADASAEERFVLQGALIVLNGDIVAADDTQDADALRAMVRSNPGVTKIVLSNEFLPTKAALEVAAVIRDVGLATEVTSQCTDACIYMFVAGSPRILAEGARIGLRRRTVPVSFLQETFEEDKLRHGWADEYGQAAYMYDRGQSDMRRSLEHLLGHGVGLEFAIRIFATPREDMWWPSRDALIEGGVIDQ